LSSADLGDSGRVTVSSRVPGRLRASAVLRFIRRMPVNASGGRRRRRGGRPPPPLGAVQGKRGVHGFQIITGGACGSSMRSGVIPRAGSHTSPRGRLPPDRRMSLAELTGMEHLGDRVGHSADDKVRADCVVVDESGVALRGDERSDAGPDAPGVGRVVASSAWTSSNFNAARRRWSGSMLRFWASMASTGRGCGSAQLVQGSCRGGG